jgi:hypothetical protein
MRVHTIFRAPRIALYEIHYWRVGTKFTRDSVRMPLHPLHISNNHFSSSQVLEDANRRGGAFKLFSSPNATSGRPLFREVIVNQLQWYLD